jgi:hypothetical protein
VEVAVVEVAVIKATVGEVLADNAPVPPFEYIHPCPYVVAPVPPFATPMVLPFHVPEVIVPSVVMLLDPAQVDRAVFSTLFSASDAFRFAVLVPASVVAPEAYSRSPGVYDVRPVPPYTTPILVVADTTPLFACSGPFRLSRYRVPDIFLLDSLRGDSA